MKTNELKGAALDWAVEKCERGYRAGYDYEVDWRNNRAKKYSINWAHGGPIIERELIETVRGGSYEENFWKATKNSVTAYGPTPLIAAMRCYVASKLGDEVDVPEKLIKLMHQRG
jgi:hypothetical protein